MAVGTLPGATTPTPAPSSVRAPCRRRHDAAARVGLVTGMARQIRTPTNALGQVSTVTPFGISDPEVRRSSMSGDA